MKKYLFILLILFFSCDEPVIEGCTTSTACNYAADADKDDGSCVAPEGCNEWCEGDTTIVLELDCIGECGGVATIDSCNVCSGGTTSFTPCIQDCNDEWGGTAWVSDCGCVAADNSGDDCDDCSGVPNGDAEEDICGVCNGDGTSCYGCTDATACNFDSTATIFDDSCWSATEECACSDGEGAVADNCGTCDNDNTNDCVQDCMGNWGGSIFDADDDGICDGLQGTVADIDGNIYKTVQIGGQVWIAENLKVTHYNNGDEIPTATDYSAETTEEWVILSTGAYAVYDNDPANADIYGRLYNWYTVDDSRGICPEDWHVPTDEEWKELEIYLGICEGAVGDGNSFIESGGCVDDNGWRGTDEGSKLAGHSDLWNDGNLDNNSEFGTSGFNGLPAGYRHPSGTFNYMGTRGHFWSSSEKAQLSSWRRKLNYSNSDVSREFYGKGDGFSIRCIKD